MPAFPRAPQPPRPTNVAKLRAELAALQKTVAERDEVTFEQAQRIFALREQLEGARASLSEQAAEQEAYRAALEVAQRELEEQLVQVQTGLEAALAALEEERRAGRISAEEAARMAATLRSEAESMRTERDAAQQLLKGFVAEAAAARKELRAREAELNDLRQNNEMLARQLAASREDNEELQRAFDVERHRLLTTHDKLQSQLASRVQELSGCERRCKDSEAKLAAEKARGDALQEREFELMGELADRDSELARKDAEIQALKKALQDCEEEMKTTNDRSAAHLKLIEEWKAKYQKAQDDLDEAKAEFDEAKAVAAMKQADYEKRLAGAMKKLNDCKNKLADAERRLQGAIEAGRKCEARERAKDEKISALLARLGQVRAEVSKHQDAERAAKAALKASQDDSKKLKDDLSRSEARRGALETQAVADAATLAEADKDIADCKRKLEDCERKLEECERRARGLRAPARGVRGRVAQCGRKRRRSERDDALAREGSVGAFWPFDGRQGPWVSGNEQTSAHSYGRVDCCGDAGHFGQRIRGAKGRPVQGNGPERLLLCLRLGEPSVGQQARFCATAELHQLEPGAPNHVLAHLAELLGQHGCHGPPGVLGPRQHVAGGR